MVAVVEWWVVAVVEWRIVAVVEWRVVAVVEWGIVDVVGWWVVAVVGWVWLLWWGEGEQFWRSVIVDSVGEKCGGCGVCREEVWWLWSL